MEYIAGKSTSSYLGKTTWLPAVYFLLTKPCFTRMHNNSRRILLSMLPRYL